MQSSSSKVVVAALVGNGLIAITKFGASAVTGSSAMLSEAIHSLVDTANQGLLLYGLKKSQKPADERHPFGYGRELYFWAFIVAILIFGAGGGFSIYEGFNKLFHPHPITSPLINYIVLGLAILFEGVAWSIAFKEFWKNKGKLSWFKAVQESKDPTIFTVLFEDSAAMLGLVVAAVGIWLSSSMGILYADAVASICIGFILVITASFLAYEGKSLLIGEGALPEQVALIRNLIQDDETILGINELLTLHAGPEDILLTVSVDFKDGLDSGEVEQSISRMEKRIKSAIPRIKKIFIEAQSFSGHWEDRALSEKKPS
jgi:cation diffusion facilitator family transporter